MIKLEIIRFIVLEILVKIPKGSNKAISISKIKKIKVVKKNRIEKGLRAFLKGENPHSKGVIFSRSLLDFSDIIIANVITIIDINKDILIDKIRINISIFINRQMSIRIIKLHQRSVSIK
mgnify:CR=1 FL=1